MKDLFRAEAYWMIAIPFALLATGFLVAIIAPRVIREFSIDRCLDAGGHFNHDANICERARSEAAAEPPSR